MMLRKIRLKIDPNMNHQPKILLFVIHIPKFFISHRLPLAVAAKEAGYEVHVATADGPEIEAVKENGFVHHVIPFTRRGQNPLKELLTFLLLFKLFLIIKPTLVHLVTIKPVLYGGIAARIAGIQHVVSAVTGLGTVFNSVSMLSAIRLRLVKILYREAFKQKHLAVIFQNHDDKKVLSDLRVFEPRQAHIIPGSGVAMAQYPILPEPEGIPVVAMAARLLKDKGVLEFFNASKILKNQGHLVIMRLIGSPDPGNPSSLTQKELGHLAAEAEVELLGYRDDIAEQYAASNIVCLPSYFGEGLPKSLVEAAACGRAVITTNHPGCKEAIIPNLTGLLVPPRDPVALADAIYELIKYPERRKRMGLAGRILAEDKFKIERIVKQHIDIYKKLLNS